MRSRYKYIKLAVCTMIIGMGLGLISCSKVNPNGLQSVSPSDFAGKVEGFDSSGQVAADNLIAYWSFDGTEAESFTGIAPTTTYHDSYIDKGVRGKAVKLDSGYLYYAAQFPKLDKSLKSFTVLAWIQILNNGSTPTLLYSLARPGQFWGNINLLLETGQNPASDLTDLVVHPDYFDGNGTQDNLNANWSPDGDNTYYSPTIGADVWTQVGMTYDSTTNILQVWGNGKRIGTTSYQQRGTSYYTPDVPNEVIIGGWYNNIPGKEVTADTWTVPMKGNVDEIRIYNVALGSADIKALYELGVAGK